MSIFAFIRYFVALLSSYGRAFAAGLTVTIVGMVVSAQFSLLSMYAEASGSSLAAQLGAASVANYAPDAFVRARQAVLKESVVEEASKDTQIQKKRDAEQAGGFGFSSDTLSVLLRTDKKLDVEAPKVVSIEEAVTRGRMVVPAPSSPAAPTTSEQPLVLLPTPVVVMVRQPPAPAPQAQPAPQASPVSSPSAPPAPVATANPPTLVFEPSGGPGQVGQPAAQPAAPSAPGSQAPAAPAEAPPPPAPPVPPPAAPTSAPTSAPSAAPTTAPTVAPTSAPTAAPTTAPTVAPTSAAPTAPTPAPTSVPTPGPTQAPTTAAPTSPPAAGSSGGGSEGSSGTVRLATDAPAVGFINLNDMNAGSAVTKIVTVSNTGTLPFTYSLTTSGGSTGLWTDASKGLQLRLRRGVAVVYDGPLQVANLPFGITLAPSGTDVIEYTVYLPLAADNLLQGLSESITFTWTASG